MEPSGSQADQAAEGGERAGTQVARNEEAAERDQGRGDQHEHEPAAVAVAAAGGVAAAPDLVRGGAGPDRRGHGEHQQARDQPQPYSASISFAFFAWIGLRFSFIVGVSSSPPGCQSSARIL